MACLKVQKGCSARPSKPAKCLMSDEWTLGDNDHGTIFHYLSNDYQTPSYLPTLTTFVLVCGSLAGWGRRWFYQLDSVASA